MEDVYRLIMGEGAPEWRKKPPALDYEALMHRAAELLPPPVYPDIASDAGFTLARLMTLSRKKHCGLPDDPSIKRALWLCLGAAAFPGDPARTRIRRREAAAAALQLTHGVPPREREALRALCAQPADAMARLLSYSININ